jgi:hypothetical protein
MKKVKYSLFFIGFTFFISCAKDNNPSVENVIFSLNVPTSAPADGTTVVYATVQLNIDATTDKRGVVFKINTGQFVSNKDTTLTQGAVFTNGKLVATAAIITPVNGKNLIVTAQPNLPDVANNAYLLSKTISLSASIPSTVILAPSSTGINSNYQNEVAITATLANSSGSKVSTGSKVIFQDFLDSGLSANGTFRTPTDTTNVSSQVITNYSTGAYAAGTRITIKSTVVGTNPAVTGSTVLFINK